MIEFETYKETLEVVDKYGIQDISVSKSLVYTGCLSNVKKDNIVEDDCVPTLAAAVIGLKNTSATLSTPSKSIYCWTDFDAQECYLNSEPTCYLILGKPGGGAYTLGEAISKKLNCIHLCPKNLILDEMEQRSKTGNCIGFNLKQQNVIKFDIILSILKKKMQSEAVKHRGYVISGLPLVSSDRKPQYLSNTLHSEEGFLSVDDLMNELLVNLKKKKPKIPKSNKDSRHSSRSSDVDSEEEVEAEAEHEAEEVAEETEEEPVVLPKFILDSCSHIIFTQKKYMSTKQAVLLQQITDIFKLSMKPDIIIHLTSPDKDLVTKKSHKYFNYTNNVYTFDPLVTSFESELRWPAKCTMSDYVSPYDSHIFNPKYNCRQPINFVEKSTEQMCNYRKYVLLFVEEKFKDFKPQHIIKLDARNPTHQMMFHLNERLMLLSIKPVLIPEPLYLEEPPEEIEDFWKLVEELNVIRNGAINFNRYPSLWLNRCPVELKKRRSQKGNPKLAVTFTKHVYLLSSLDSMIAFCRNPRPFLKLKYLEPTCRIIVIGTQTSGKTMVSHCLSWLFDTPITSYNDFVENEKEKKYEMYAKTILSEIIATIEDDRLLIWKNRDTERISNFNEWNNNNLNKLRSYVAFFIEILKFESKRDKTAEEELQKPEPEELDPQLLTDYEYLRNQLSFLPFLENIDQCMKAVESQTLIQFAPQELVTEAEKPGTPVLGDADVTKAIYNYIIINDLQKEIEPNNEELMNELVKILSDNDNDSLQNVETYAQFIIDGFPSDPECWSYLSDAKLLPDHTIALIENREIDQELVLYYADVAKCHKNYQERLAMTNDPLIKAKNKVKPFPDAYIVDIGNIVNESISTILDTLFAVNSDNVPVEGENKESPDADLVGTLTAAVEKFREDWDSLKLKTEESSKFYVEIELENKTDVEVLDEILLNLRKNYYLTCEVNEDDDTELLEDDNENPKDVLTYNDPRNLCETSIYCPIAFYNYGVLWEGKPELSVKYNNKLHYFSKEHCSELFQSDVTRYQQYNKPYKSFPPQRICVVGCIGSGKTTISKLIAKELGLIHVDFSEIVNIFLMPKHFKKVGRQYENTFTDVSIDEEGVTEFQIDEENENLASDILGSETEMRRMVYNYFERGTPIVSVLMQKIIKKLWFEDPFVTTGFVLDGFPRLPSDVEDMITCFCVPDLVIELEGNSESMLQRLPQKYYKTWKTQLNEAKRKAKLILDNEMRDWMNFITKHVVAKLIFEDIFDVIFASTEQPTKELSAGSVIMDAHPQGSSNVDVNLFNFYNDMTQEYPAPVDLNEWEKPDEARERIDARLESIYEVEDQGLQSLKDILLEQRIKTVPIDSTKSFSKVLRIVLFKLANLRNRCISFFEQTFVIGCDIAEMLLLEGFFFLSQFARMCPVYLFENHSTILNPFKIMKRKEKVFPVIHRACIYFVFGGASLSKFRTNPLKYINADFITSFKEHPLTISVIGPPKSGKSTLAEKLSKRFGLICISRGKAVRYILNHMNWTELGIRMNDTLYRGACINSEHIMKAVQVLALDHRTVTYGFVFDGFPETTSEALELTNAGLYPNIIFDISNDIEAAKKHALDEIYYSIIKLKPPYSAPFIENRYINWSRKSYQIRNWVMQDVQNIHLINGKDSRWQCIQNATGCIEETITKIHYYLNNVSDKIVSPSCMGISNDIFRKRMSHFKNMCPLCLQINVLRHSDYPVDKKGVVQYKYKFYWICPNHMTSVLKYPDRYLSVMKVEIPEIPATVKIVNPSLVYENGICIVTYAEHLPAQKIVRGSHKYAATFKGKTYLFCSLKCQDTFLAKPHMFCDITVFKETKMFPALTLKNLPNLGYLEQTIGNIITEACCAVNVLRPKYPGLDIRVSALLYIALYLKTHNSLTVESVLALFEKVSKVYEARCKLVLDIGLRLRSMDNPFVMYPKCCNKIRYLDSGTVGKPSSITNDSISVHTVVSEFQK